MIKSIILSVIFFYITNVYSSLKIENYHKFEWKEDWTNSIYKSIDELNDNRLLDVKVNSDDLVKLGCPKFNEATADQKKDFWVVFLSSLARSESGLNERARSPKRRGHRSYGLLQLAPETASKYCNLILLEEEILDGEDNLSCGIKLLNWQLAGAPTPSGKKLRPDLEGHIFGKNILLWGPLRSKDKNGRKRLYQWFNKHLDQLPFCE